MKKLVFWLLPLAVLAWGCTGDQITTDGEGTTDESGISVDCSTMNTDIAALQVLACEATAGSTVTDLSGSVITFSSGETATVTVRDSYAFDYVNPTVSIGTEKWLIDGSEISSSFADETLKFKGSKGYWYAWYNSAWNKLSEIQEGDSVPVFASLYDDDDNVYVLLSGGKTFSYAKYAGDETISLSDSGSTLEKDGGSVKVTVTSNTAWTAVSSASWLSVSPASGSEGDTEVTVSADANDSYSRSATITFSTGSVSAKFTVSQSGELSGGTIESEDTEDSDDNVANTEFDRTIYITWSSSGATVTGDGNGIVSVSGGQVTANNVGTDEVVIYELSGSTSNGMFKVYSNRKQAIVLNGVSITNPSGAAINVQGTPAAPNKGKRTFVVVTGSNTLADGSSAAYSTVYSSENEEEDQKAVFFSEGQLIFSGSGSLTITANNQQGKAALTSDDYVRVMSSPTINISSGSSAGHGVRGKDYILISNGTVDVTVAANMKKGFSSDSLVRFDGGATTIKVTGSAAYDSEDKEYSGTAGIKADQLFEMNGGSLSITNTGTGGKGISGDSYGYFNGGTVSIDVSGANFTGSKSLASDYTVGSKGIKFDGDLYFKGSTVKVYCKRHEGIESKGNLTISGGSLYVVSDGDDAINCSKVLTMSGGYAFAQSTGSYARSNGKPGDAFDSNGNMVLSGGVAFGVTSQTPDLAFDANTEGGASLYIKSGATVIALGGVESGTSSNWAQSVYSGSWSKSTNYALYNSSGSLICAFKTPSSGASGLYVSGPSLSSTACKSGVTLSGGTSYANGMIIIGGTVSGGSTLSLSSYSGGNGGGGGGGGRPGGW